MQDVTYLKNIGHTITSSMPIHRAINNNAPSDTIIMLAEMYPDGLLEPHSDGKLALQAVADSEKRRFGRFDGLFHAKRNHVPSVKRRVKMLVQLP